jgi:hypothetical protein
VNARAEAFIIVITFGFMLLAGALMAALRNLIMLFV